MCARPRSTQGRRRGASNCGSMLIDGGPHLGLPHFGGCPSEGTTDWSIGAEQVGGGSETGCARAACAELQQIFERLAQAGGRVERAEQGARRCMACSPSAAARGRWAPRARRLLAPRRRCVFVQSWWEAAPHPQPLQAGGPRHRRLHRPAHSRRPLLSARQLARAQRASSAHLVWPSQLAPRVRSSALAFCGSKFAALAPTLEYGS